MSKDLVKKNTGFVKLNHDKFGKHSGVVFSLFPRILAIFGFLVFVSSLIFDLNNYLHGSYFWYKIFLPAFALFVSLLIFFVSRDGREFIAYCSLSLKEIKKVVFPTRKEIIQTALYILIFVLLMALFLWVLDKILAWLLYGLILGVNK